MARPAILYVASTASHLKRFHQPYIEGLRAEFNVFTMANGKGVDFEIPFQKHFFSLKNFGAIRSIRRILRRGRFAGVILNTSLAAFLVRAAMIGQRGRPAVLNLVHGYLFDLPVKGKWARFMLLCERLVARYTDEIAVMNACDLEIARNYQLTKGKVHFIRGMGFVVDRNERASEGDLRERISPSGERILTYVGELSARKNQIFLIRCVGRLRARGISVRLMLVGEGRSRPRLEAEARALGVGEQVLFLGNCEPVTPYLEVTDLYVSASRTEGLPFNVMEAMACGLPMILSDCKGQRDLMGAYPDRLYPVDDEAAFCTLVEQALKEDPLGVGAVEYQGLEAYTLEAVFQENLKIMKGFL